MQLRVNPTRRGFAQREAFAQRDETCPTGERKLNPLGKARLTQEMAAALIPLLQRFVESGDLKPTTDE